jgi:hypothetical protein
MGFKRFDDVVLLTSVEGRWLQEGEVGTVLEVHRIEGSEPGYRVEFFDMLGDTLADDIFPESALRLSTIASQARARNKRVEA